ncbi:hypothetical protein Q4601_16560 [Shewanella sp. 1_MG-2023]|uniref:Lipoprotein n=1 Tax=Shewanella electrodiphila TaxID=934143 RepID=A0ABT0KMT9_9GAMM|nr:MULTISPECIES: hypothetical protein [Shewanella]MCL1044660.1 hypothetical protein [Shewanella electrodiphila]MDO6610259.1 hypothetical protein [Shewanella sp. 7_MG-2023]MDO6770384.1 hypothetical protein [Shewanella sp. 2_MG-2023]MDO6795918.1 hypothetical protein [Shewanella sp. 1_MG-2023]
MKSKIILLLIPLSLLIITACQSTRDSMVEQGYPLAYADGFQDGCDSGNKAGGSLFDQFKKDVTRFNSETDYAQGWSDGFRQCETEQESIQRQVRMSIEQQNLQQQKKTNELAEQHALEREVMKGVDTSGLKSLEN